MNEYISRTIAISSGVLPVTPVAAAAASTSATERATSQPSVPDDYAHVAADVAKVRGGISDTLATISQSTPSTADLGQAEQNIVSLMPQPSVVVPLPPASDEMASFVTQVTQSIANQAAQTRAAQANASPALVEATATY